MQLYKNQNYVLFEIDYMIHKSGSQAKIFRNIVIEPVYRITVQFFKPNAEIHRTLSLI